MEPLTIETFNPDIIKVINLEQKKAGNINYTSVKFTYEGAKMPPVKVDGKFKLFKFKNDKTDIYSLSIKCNKENERFFERLCEVVAKESCRLVPNVNGRKLKPEEFELITQDQIIQYIRDGCLFGFVECDTEVPDHLKDYFSEMTPIYKNDDVSLDDIG